MQNKLAVVFTQPVFAGTSNQEGLDLAMLAASFGQDVALFFIDDGVWLLNSLNNAQVLGRKNVSKALPAMEFYDIDHLYVCESSLAQRQLPTDKLLGDIQLLSCVRISQLLADYPHIVRF